jgi:hypothetical protein
MKQPKLHRSTIPSNTNLTYILIFLIGSTIWFLVRLKFNTIYSDWIEQHRWTRWSSETHGRLMMAINIKDDGDEDKIINGNGSPQSARDGETDEDESGGETNSKTNVEDLENDVAEIRLDPKQIAKQRLIDELKLLESAVIERSEEEQLFTELLRTKGKGQVKLADPLPPGPIDQMFMDNFEQELKHVSDKWEEQFQRVVSARKESSLEGSSSSISNSNSDLAEELNKLDIVGEPKNEEELSRVANWQVQWERKELDRMIADAKAKIGYTTLTGKKPYVSFVPSSGGGDSSTTTNNNNNGNSGDGKSTNNNKLNSQNNGQQQQQQNNNAANGITNNDPNNNNNNGRSTITTITTSNTGQTTTTTTTNSGATVTTITSEDFGVDAEVPLPISVPQLTASNNPPSESDIEELLSTLQQLEANAMQYTSKKVVVVLGEKTYIGRDLKVYKWAFGLRGFTIKMGSSSTGLLNY